MKIVTVNIEGSNHLDRVSKFLATEKPDVVCMQEVYKADISRFEQELNMRAYYAPISNIDRDWPRFPGKGTEGVAIFAREYSDTETMYYVKPDEEVPVYDGSIEGAKNAVVAVRCSHEGKMYDIATTHFTWSDQGKKSDRQEKDMKALLACLEHRKPDIVCGDFNAPVGGEIRAMITAVYKENIPSDVKTSIDNELHDDGSKIPGGIQLVVDGMFSNDRVTVSNVRVVSGVSDHCAIVGDIEIQG